MGIGSWFAGGAILGSIGAAWGHIKRVWERLTGLLIVRIDFANRTGQDVVEHWVWDKTVQHWSVAPWRVMVRHLYVRSQTQRRLVPLRTLPGKGGLFWVGKVPVAWKRDDDGWNISFLRGTLDRADVLKQICDHYHSSLTDTKRIHESSRFRFVQLTGQRGRILGAEKEGLEATEEACDSYNILRERPVGYVRDDLGEPVPESALEKLSLDQESRVVCQEIFLWRDRRKWFVAHDVPWKFGVLFAGMLGTGKTATARALAVDLDFPIFRFDLASMGNQDFLTSWEKCRRETPCMILIEDIDGVFNGRTNVTDGTNREPGLTFDCLLNAIDGVEKSDGILLVVTTNNPATIDPAMAGEGKATRPGRIDRVLTFRELDAQGRRKIANRILDAWPELAEETVKAGEGETGAAFQNRCSKRALEKFWENPEGIQVEEDESPAIRGRIFEKVPIAQPVVSKHSM